MKKDKENTEDHKDQDKYTEETENLKSPEDLAEEAQLTDEDREALGPRDLSMDGGDDEQLKHREHPVDFDASELDIPGRKQDDAQEKLGSEDEENNHYSLGGDAHNDLERDDS